MIVLFTSLFLQSITATFVFMNMFYEVVKFELCIDDEIA